MKFFLWIRQKFSAKTLDFRGFTSSQFETLPHEIVQGLKTSKIWLKIFERFFRLKLLTFFKQCESECLGSNQSTPDSFVERDFKLEGNGVWYAILKLKLPVFYALS